MLYFPPRFYLMVIALLTACGLTLAGCASAPRAPAPAAHAHSDLTRHEYSEVHMGVRARIVLHAETEALAVEAARAAFARIAQLDAIMSDYRVDSELMRLSDRAGQGPVQVSDELFEVLSFAQDLHEKSGGVFDVTAGPAVQLWREMRRTGTLAGAEAIAAARDLVGSQWMVLDASSRTVELQKPGMRLDLGGIAKGYACDAAAQVLREHGVTRFLVAMAGDIVVGEAPPGRDDWEVRVEGGVGASSPQGAPVLHLLNQAVSTSGDAEQFVEIDGRRYSHLVDPRTGLGSSRRIAATVVAPRGMMSDSIATALCLLSADAGLILAGRYEQVGAIIEEVAFEGTRIRSTGCIKSVP